MGVRIAICQMPSAVGEVNVNLNKVLETISDTKADVYVFPELFLTGYGADYRALEHEIQYAVDRISLRCMEMDVAVAVGCPAYSESGITNSLLFITHDGIVQYDKLYLARFGVYAEDGFVPGRGPRMGRFNGITFGLSICYDIFFPEIYRAYAVAGADVNICIAASAEPSRQYLERVLPARSLENVVYTVYVNNIGKYRNETFYGHSRLVGPLGNTLNETGGSSDVMCVYVDKEVVDNARNERKHMSDLRRDIAWDM